MFAAVLGIATVASAFADRPWNYAVQITASVDAGSNRIMLQWTPPDPQANGGATPQHVVYRKNVADLGNTDWGSGTTVPAGQNAYADTVQPGVAYEYKVTRIYTGTDPQFNGVGYIRTGIGVPLVEDRGTALLVVESSVADALSAELTQLTADLAGDGWHVVRIDGLSASSNPTDVRNRIHDEAARVGNAQAVLLIGHLPTVWSGNATNPDGHFIRAMPADGFYGVLTGDWGPATFTDGHWVYTRNTFPADVGLAVGRIDFADLPAIYAVSPFGSEVAMLKNYFAKDHAYRTAQRVPERRALIGDAFGEYYFDDVVEPFAADGYRNFAPLVNNQITAYDNYHGANNVDNWLSALTSGSWLWAYADGPGGDTGDAIGALGPGDLLRSEDLVSQNAKADFYLFFASYIVDWTKPNNLLRSALAPADYGLAAVWSGRPFLDFHAMGMGDTLGDAFRLSENSSGSLYETPVTVRPDGNTYPRAVYMALLGDPTLRLDPVPMVTGFNADANTGLATWSPPPGANVQEYRVYRANSDAGGLQLEATLPANTRAYTTAQTGRYVLRAVVLQQGSGTYFDASEGTWWTVNGTTGVQPPPPPPPPPTPDPTPQPLPTPSPQMSPFSGVVNLSSRLRITGADGVSAGFVIAGSSPVQVLVRAAGPTLASFGVAGAVSDPQLRVLDRNGNEIGRNTGWGNDSRIAAAAAAVGAFPLKGGSADAALLITLDPGLYTAEIHASQPGTVLVEMYAVNASNTATPLVNLSTRGAVGTGADALVGGFVISGSDPKKILIRAVGPGLAAFGVGGTLSDPVLTLRTGQGAELAHNDNWENGEKTDVVVGPTPGDIAQANTAAGAFALTPGSRDAALVVQLPPGSYSATVEGANGGTGAALLEIYEVQ